ncbi:MAG: MCE family protein [Candidatus Cloacimonetes bacterium]|nr:MlaD family protein [Candidatus Cloacimonadota bacterium]NLO11058.1 MCE family protein [Candidatus Cloacimonadota bacterium]
MKKFYPDIKSVQVRVGLFTIIIAILLILGNLWLSNKISTRSLQDLKVSFTDVSGLEVGDKVMYRGMEVGRVKQIGTQNENVIVKSRIHSDIRIREGSSFVIGDSSLMGGKTLSIIPGDGSGWLSMAAVHKGEEPAGVMGIVNKASGAIVELQAVLQELRSEQGLIAKGANLMDDADSAVRNVDAITGELKYDISSALARLDALTERIDALVKSNSADINQAISAAPAAIADLQGTLDSLKTLGGEINKTMGTINSGKGTAGRIINDDELYTRLLESIENLDKLVQDVKANPKKYVKFSLF